MTGGILRSPPPHHSSIILPFPIPQIMFPLLFPPPLPPALNSRPSFGSRTNDLEMSAIDVWRSREDEERVYRALDSIPRFDPDFVTLEYFAAPVNGSWALFHALSMPNLPEGIAGLVGSPYLLQEEAIVSYHLRTMVTAKHPIRPIVFSNSEELEDTLAACKQSQEDFLTRLSEPLALESNGDQINLCCPEDHERDCPSPFSEEEFDANEDQDLGNYRVEQKPPDERLRHIVGTLKLEELNRNRVGQSKTWL